MPVFSLDPRLAADTVPVGELDLSRVLLMNDARFPWLVLVPRKEDCTELHDLTTEEQRALINEITLLSRLVRSFFSAEKINVGALGNIVPQLHVHIIGRRKGDQAWPGPVWGFGKALPYTSAERTRLVGTLSAAIATLTDSST